MNATTTKNQPLVENVSPPNRWLWGAMLLLVIAGLGVSGYLLWGYTVPNASLACGGSHGCESVKNSAYSSVLGVSLPVWGLAVYIALLGLVVAQKHRLSAENGRRPYIALAIFTISLVGVLFSAYLTYLELFVIFAICRWCVASAVIMTALFILSIFNLQQNNQLQ